MILNLCCGLATIGRKTKAAIQAIVEDEDQTRRQAGTAA